jgi:hypothetical protein
VKTISEFIERQSDIARLDLPQFLPQMIKFTRYLKCSLSSVFLKQNGCIREPLEVLCLFGGFEPSQ